MKRVFVYSHDTYGLGNIRRMLGICERLLLRIPDLSILLVTGSPMIQSFRLPPRLDYIKLPCVSRTASNVYEAKSLGTNPDETMRLRRDLIASAAQNFKPDLILVDKKPYGVKNELRPVLDAARTHGRHTPVFLVLRDILDAPEVTIASWRQNGCYDAVARSYDRILVLGLRSLFDAAREYEFPDSWNSMVQFCGYTRRTSSNRSAQGVRRALGVQPGQELVVVTPGGGEDGAALVRNYIEGLKQKPNARRSSLLIGGPEMDPQARRSLEAAMYRLPNSRFMEFTDDLMSYVSAADLVVAMGGYNTVCEILSANRRCVLVPRARPVQEQLIRAQRLSDAGYVRFLHPDLLTPESLTEAVDIELRSSNLQRALPLDLHGLDRIADLVEVTLNPGSSGVSTQALRQTSAPAQFLTATASLA